MSSDHHRPMTMESNFDINEIVQEAQCRWLKSAEVHAILQNHENYQLTEAPPQKPLSGSLFLFNKRVVRFFRKDGHNWRRKKSGRTVGEGHERLKVGSSEALNCYYAHGEENSNFQRRSYWMLDPAYEHIVLVHYREISEGRHDAKSTSYLLPGCSTTSPSINGGENQGSISEVSKLNIPQLSLFSPGSTEVSSELVTGKIGMHHLDGTEEFNSSPVAEVSQAFQNHRDQLSLNVDDLADIPISCQEVDNNSEISDYKRRSNQDDFVPLQHGSEYRDIYETFSLYESNNLLSLPNSGEYEVQGKESSVQKDMLDQCPGSIRSDPQDQSFNALDATEKLSSSSERVDTHANLAEQQEKWGSHWLDNSENRNNLQLTLENSVDLQFSEHNGFIFGSNDPITSPTLNSLLQEVENSKVSLNSSGTTCTNEAVSDYCSMFVQESQFGVSLDGCSMSTLSQSQKFKIQEISPEWGYSTEETKVIITGSFLCDPSESRWTCMFGNIEVPTQIIQDGVLSCHAPPHFPGKVTLCIASGNGEPCSQLTEFEYRNCNLPQTDATKSTEEMLLLVRFAEMVCRDALAHKEDIMPLINVTRNPWENIIHRLLVGSETPSSTMEWLVQEFLKDKLQQWLSSKHKKGDMSISSLSKEEQNIIHMVAGLGFEWALNPILNSGVSINFRDLKGWTALHWAAHFGREKMVAALIAAGASAGAVTDPTSQDPVGKTPGFIAAAHGHKGLAGYLSEVALTSHLSSLTLEESELSKESAAEVAERTIESISKESAGITEDQLSLKDSLAAVRNAAQAAARIQAAFHAYSFRRRQLRESVDAICDEFGITLDDIRGLSATSNLVFKFCNDLKLNRAALSIQKKYRGWKGRQRFLALRQKIVMIQARVRGYQVRKRYKVIVRAVGILEKVVLRWRRGGAGLRGFQPQSESADEFEYEDILKPFRKQKVDMAVADALSQVLSMVGSSDARHQYRRILESYCQAKAKLSGSASETASISPDNNDFMENDDYYQFLWEQTLDFDNQG